MVTELEDILCLSVDAESESGRPLAERFHIEGLPSVVLLNSDGSARDSIRGYLPRPLFLAELRRIEEGTGTLPALRARIAANSSDLVARLDLASKLRTFGEESDARAQIDAVAAHLERGEGFDPQSVDERWALCTRLRSLGEKVLASRQIVAIGELDPEGTSYPSRRLRLEAALEELYRRRRAEPLRDLLAREEHERIAYEGWCALLGYAESMARKVEGGSRSRELLALQVEAARAAWPLAPEGERALLGNRIAWGLWVARARIEPEDEAFALEVAEAAVALEPLDVNIIDTHACCLYMNGRVKEAVRRVRRCIELDPENIEWQARLQEFLGG